MSRQRCKQMQDIRVLIRTERFAPNPSPCRVRLDEAGRVLWIDWHCYLSIIIQMYLNYCERHYGYLISGIVCLLSSSWLANFIMDLPVSSTIDVIPDSLYFAAEKQLEPCLYIIGATHNGFNLDGTHFGPILHDTI